MRDITVNKEKLIKTLKKNRKKHRSIFLTAQKVYREQMIAELDRALQEASNGGKIIRGFSLPVPEEHTADFDTAIGMLEWHEGKKVTLPESEYRMYVENEWGWQHSFAGSTMAYAAMAE